MIRWIHYSRRELLPSPPPCEASPPCVHATRARYYAPGTAWRDWASRYLDDREYTHRYQLDVALKALRLLHIDRSSIGGLKLGELCEFDWETARAQGYDGVYVHRGELLADRDTPLAWRIFASAREHDELIIWANDRVIDLPMDWPRRNKRRRTRRD